MTTVGTHVPGTVVKLKAAPVPGTGLQSPSGLLAVFGVLLGSAGPIVTALEANGWSWQRTVSVGLGGAVFASVSAAVKILHDKGIHIATIQAAGSEVAKALPGLRADLDTFLSDHPQDQQLLADLKTRFESFANKVPDVGQAERMIESAVSRIVTERFSAPAPTAQPLPAPITPTPLVPQTSTSAPATPA